MSLFNFKKNTCSCGCNSAPNQQAKENPKNSNIAQTTSIKVLGTGCSSCHKLYENTKKAISNLNVPVEVQYITDLQTIMNYGIMSMPALIINEQTISAGKVLTVSEIENILT